MEKTPQELEIENQFLVDYFVAYNEAGVSKWTGRGPTSILKWLYKGIELTQADKPYSLYEWETLVRFMEHVPYHLLEAIEPAYEHLRQAWLGEKEVQDRQRTLASRRIIPLNTAVSPQRMR